MFNLDISHYFFGLTILMTCLGFFIKKWIVDLEKKIDKVCKTMESKIDKTQLDLYCDKYNDNHEIFIHHSHTEDGKVVLGGSQN